MKICILVFSPTGNTLKIGKMLHLSLTQKGAEVQLVDSTRCDMIFKENDRKNFLDNNIKSHDVLIIGGPVYSHHMQHNLLRLIEALPLPSEKWGCFAIPFTTFGTISSGEALYEAAELLKKSGRNNILGMKVEAFHCFTKKWDKKINENMPGEEALPYIEELATEIMNLKVERPNKINDISDLFNYQSKSAKIKANVFLREKQMHKYVFPKVKFNYAKCKSCGRCEKVCAVQCIEMNNGFPVQVNSNECIHCAECFHNCPFDAISLNIRKYESMLMKGAQGKGILTSNEKTKTEVFFNDSIYRC